MSVRKFVPKRVKNAVAKALELISPSSASVRGAWVRKPQIADGAEVCLFVTLARNGRVTEQSEFHARAWAQAGFELIMIIVTDDPESAREQSSNFAAGVFVRANRGYDFGAWAAVINQLPELRNASLLATVNDSVFGPVDSFSAMLVKVRQADADMIGTTESFEYRRHFQSFLLFFKEAALVNDAFWRFWRNVRTVGRAVVIRQYETRLVETLERAGLRCVPLFPSQPAGHHNQTLARWRELLDEGFPYLKVSLLRDNPLAADLEGWEEELESRGYDPGIVRRHLNW
jgi:lipopolysaccharide biosynthesis protein